MTPPLIHIRLQQLPLSVDVRRGTDVPDTFWLLVRAEWGSEGGTPGHSIAVPLERFLSQLAWLAPACRRYGVGVDWDEHSRELIKSRNEERRLLTGLLENPPDPDREGTATLLKQDGSRFARELRDFQERDLAQLVALPHGANFSVPGAGKTTVAYAAYEIERLRGRVKQMLVVAPLSAFIAWTEEAEICFTSPPKVAVFGGGAIAEDTEVLVVNYQRLASQYQTIAEWTHSKPTLVLLDEAHRMKRGWEGLWGSTCLNLAFLAERRDILTGTPAPQGPGDFLALLNFVWPNQARNILPRAALLPSPTQQAMHAIGGAIEPLFVRTTKHELGLTPPTHAVITVPLTGIHEAIYQALLKQYRGRFGAGRRELASFGHMGEIVMYLLEAATNPGLLAAGSSRHDPVVFRHPPLDIPPQSELADLLAQYGEYETPAKFIELAKLVEGNASQGLKTLIWSNFVRNLATMERMLARYQPALIHGGIPSELTSPRAPRTRELELARFKKDPECLVLLANPAASGEGISLHDVCHDAIYLERTFNAGQYLQSVDRIHRLGLAPDQETRITFLLTENTIDEHVDRRVREKSHALGMMLEDPDIVAMSLPDDEDYGQVLDSDEDLAALFAHLRGEDVD